MRKLKPCNRTDDGRFGIKHGLYGTRLYHIWNGMMGRCCNPNNKDYESYGGRGITVFNDWKNSENFFGWALNNGYNKERLVDLLKDFHKPTADDDWDEEELEIYRDEEAVKATEAYYDELADFLLSNGVIVPPCKVGSCIYLISKNSSVPAVTRIDNVLFDGDAIQYNMDDDMFFDFSEDDIGKTAFATYEAAEQALKERENNDL